MARHHHHRHHHRRNPGRAGSLLWTVGGAAGGFLGVKSIPGMFGLGTSGIMGYAVQGGVAFVGSWLLKKVNRSAAFGFLIGGGAAIALQLYQDYTSGALSSGTSFYASQNFPLPYATGPGSPFVNAFPAAYPGGTATLPVGTSAASAGMIASTGGRFSSRLKGRFS